MQRPTNYSLHPGTNLQGLQPESIGLCRGSLGVDCAGKPPTAQGGFEVVQSFPSGFALCPLQQS
jgi:hypothetical protein